MTNGNENISTTCHFCGAQGRFIPITSELNRFVCDTCGEGKDGGLIAMLKSRKKTRKVKAHKRKKTSKFEIQIPTTRNVLSKGMNMLTSVKSYSRNRLIDKVEDEYEVLSSKVGDKEAYNIMVKKWGKEIVNEARKNVIGPEVHVHLDGEREHIW